MDDRMEIPEIVGSKDLREVFKEKGRIRGSFYINNVEFHQFEANSIENLVAAINAKEDQAFVTASIDDGYHLVLEAHSPAPILLRAGNAYVDVPTGNDATANAVGETVRSIIAEERSHQDHGDREDRKHKNTVLEDLGLEATKGHDHHAAPGSMQAGLNAEKRKEARMQRAAQRGAIRAPSLIKQPPAVQGSRAVPQSASVQGAESNDARFNPVPGKTVPPMVDWSDKQQNNPDFQLAPASNSDRQPAVDGTNTEDKRLGLRHPS